MPRSFIIFMVIWFDRYVPYHKFYVKRSTYFFENKVIGMSRFEIDKVDKQSIEIMPREKILGLKLLIL